MDLLDQGSTTAAEGTVSAVGGSDEMITQETVARSKTGGSYRRLPTGVEGNVRSQRGCDRSKVLIGEVLERNSPGRNDSCRACVCNCRGERERLTHNHCTKIRDARGKSYTNSIQAAKRKEG